MKLEEIIHPSWGPIMPYLRSGLPLQLSQEILPNIVHYPEKQNIFRVFKMPMNSIKVVILGQDPYFNPGQANGLAFAVNYDVKLPPSLNIIFNEIRRESNNDPYTDKTLEDWEEQGVFLLNTALTVEGGKPGSHLAYWEDFTKMLITFIATNQPTIWMLWGKKAQAFADRIPNRNKLMVKGYTEDTIKDIPASPYYNYVLTAAHPAAEAYNGGNAGFYGCNHFLFANTILEKNQGKTINW